jgi:hypothetical protein
VGQRITGAATGLEARGTALFAQWTDHLRLDTAWTLPCHVVERRIIQSILVVISQGRAPARDPRPSPGYRKGFAQDSPLEQAGFEPSVPRDTTNFQEAAVCHLLARYSPKACLVPGAQGSRG